MKNYFRRYNLLKFVWGSYKGEGGLKRQQGFFPEVTWHLCKYLSFLLFKKAILMTEGFEENTEKDKGWDAISLQISL